MRQTVGERSLENVCWILESSYNIPISKSSALQFTKFDIPEAHREQWLGDPNLSLWAGSQHSFDFQKD